MLKANTKNFLGIQTADKVAFCLQAVVLIKHFAGISTKGENHYLPAVIMIGRHLHIGQKELSALACCLFMTVFHLWSREAISLLTDWKIAKFHIFSCSKNILVSFLLFILHLHDVSCITILNYLVIVLKYCKNIRMLLTTKKADYCKMFHSVSLMYCMSIMKE